MHTGMHFYNTSINYISLILLHIKIVTTYCKTLVIVHGSSTRKDLESTLILNEGLPFLSIA